MTEVEHINPSGLAAPPGGVYTHVVRTGGTVYIAGQVGRDLQGNVAEGDVVAQYKQVTENLRAAMESVGGTLEQIVKTTTYVVGEENVRALLEHRRQVRLPRPATGTLVVISALATPSLLVEVEAVGYLGG